MFGTRMPSSRFYVFGTRSRFPAKMQTLANDVTNGDFRNGTAGWIGIDSVVNGIAQFIAAVQYGGSIWALSNPTSYRNHVIYAAALFKATSKSVVLSVADGVTTTTAAHTGDNTFIRRSIVKTVAAGANFLYAKIQDNRATGRDTVYFYKYILIDLTARYGAGNEPTVTQMDASLARFPDSWFDGTVTITV